MFEAYLALLDTIRQKRFSLLVNNIRKEIIKTLRSDKFSARMRQYLEGMHEEGEPFTDFSLEPGHITQIKKIINALYHAEIALQDLESVNLRDGDRKVADLAKLYNHTIHHIYQASYLITHLDVDLSEIFTKELAALAPLLENFHAYAHNYTEETRTFLGALNYRDISHKTGVISGIVVDQLQRQDGEVDYEFLTQFTATLPGYLDQFTAYIRRFSEQVTHEPVFDKKKIEELQNHGLLLLNSLESLQGSNSFFLSLRALHYIHIIRHTITLTMSIIDQAGHMTETSQDTIRDNLAKLKYELLPELFGFVDKLEAQAMLEPGVLSKPLMARVKPMYQWLMYYVQKLVDFSQKGEELLIIEDPKFIAARTEQTYQRLAEDEEKLFLLAEAQHAANEFFKILKNPGYQRKRLVDLPDEIKNQLIFYYRMMQPYMARVDVVKDNVIIAGLTQTRDFFTTFSSWLGQYSDGIPEIVALEDNLKDVFVKEQRSRRFQRQLNLDIIDSVHQSSDASSLFPYSSKEPPLAIDEAVALGVDESSVLAFAKTGSHNLLANPQELTFAQAIKLYKFYEIKSIQSVHALKAYQDFVELLNTQNNATLFVRFDEPLKKQLISLYRVFQPYLVHVTAGDKATAEYDRKIVQALTGNLSSRTGIRVSDVHRLNTAIHTCLVETNERLEAKKQAFGHKASALYQEENRAKPLVHAKGAERAHYVIRQTEYLRILADFRSSLMQLTQVFNHSIREKLEPASEGIPFPELEDVHKALSQSSQVLMLKRLFNALYYLEQIGASLNELNDKSTEINYVRHILKASSYVYEIINLGNALRSEPYLAFIAQDILQNVQKGYAKFMQLARPYLMEATEEQPDEKPQVNAVMLYSLNAMMILPEHIAALRGEKEFPPERMQAIHKHAEKVATNIQRIIAHSNSYVRLLFEIPTMYGLFRELKSKLSLMASSSHDAVLDHLEDMRNVLFPRILLEADEWEDKLGLNPGTLSSAMKAILDEFYCGLLEPLDLHSRRHLALVTSAVPLDKRLEATRQRINQAEIEQVRLREKLEKLEKLAGSISLYKAHKAKPTTTLATVQHLERSMREQFVAALPLLRQETAYLDINSLPEETGSMSVDRALNQVHGSDLKNIESLAKASISHLRGLHASHQLTIETAREKSAYLHEQKIMQQDFNAKFVLDYTTSAFRKHAKAFSSRPFGLVHSSREYKRNLFNYLQAMEKEIVEASLEAEDINKQISDLLGEKIKHFEEENYQKYYHLETIMLAIEAFKLYLHNANIELQNNNSIFENRETLIIKSQLIEKLENIARNEQLPIDDRVEQLKKETSKPTFKTQMLKYHQYDQICFAWLKQCVLSFLELIHLYTPTYKKQYNKLVKAAEEVPETGYLSARFGLFSAPRRNYDLPSEVVAIDPVALPTAAPV